MKILGIRDSEVRFIAAVADITQAEEVVKEVDRIYSRFPPTGKGGLISGFDYFDVVLAIFNDAGTKVLVLKRASATFEKI